MTACTISKNQVDKTQTNLQENNEGMSLQFDILPKEIGPFKDMDYLKYLEIKIPATLKQVNYSNATVEIDSDRMFVWDENYQISNLKGEPQDSLINDYHYQVLFDPDSYTSPTTVKLKPNDFLIDTVNLTQEFNFYLSSSDTFLIRMKDIVNSGNWIYSNWDTLIVR